MGVQEFYETMYGPEPTSRRKPSFFERHLGRFAVNRYQLACQFAPGGNSLLDIGCGDGELLFMLESKYKEVYGIDIAKPRINRAQRSLGDDSHIHVRVEDANERLNFEDASFDTITAIAMLEHIFDPYHFIQECHRLLNKEGTLIVEVPNIAWLPHRIRLAMGKLPVTSDAAGWDGGHLHYFTGSSLKKLLLDGGFNIRVITSGGIFANLRRVWGSLLAPDIFMVAIKK